MKLTITGDAYALTSTIKVVDIDLLKKYNPDALTVKDKESKQPVFGVSYSEGRPNVASFGATFGGKTRDENGYATITGAIPAEFNSEDAAKNFVAEKFGSVVDYLEQLEKSIPDEAGKIKEERKQLLNSITIV